MCVHNDAVTHLLLLLDELVIQSVGGVRLRANGPHAQRGDALLEQALRRTQCQIVHGAERAQRHIVLAEPIQIDRRRRRFAAAAAAVGILCITKVGAFAKVDFPMVVGVAFVHVVAVVRGSVMLDGDDLVCGHQMRIRHLEYRLELGRGHPPMNLDAAGINAPTIVTINWRDSVIRFG